MYCDRSLQENFMWNACMMLCPQFWIPHIKKIQLIQQSLRFFDWFLNFFYSQNFFLHPNFFFPPADAAILVVLTHRTIWNEFGGPYKSVRVFALGGKKKSHKNSASIVGPAVNPYTQGTLTKITDVLFSIKIVHTHPPQQVSNSDSIDGRTVFKMDRSKCFIVLWITDSCMYREPGGGQHAASCNCCFLPAPNGRSRLS